MLGQVLKAEQKTDDARNACAQALRADPNYIAAELCLADLCAVEHRWEEMLRYADTAVALDPTNDPHAYFYTAGAYFGLHRLPEAEKNALKAIGIDIHLVLFAETTDGCHLGNAGNRFQVIT